MAGKPAVVTRVVDSMTDNLRTTCAEATDIENAVLDGNSYPKWEINCFFIKPEKDSWLIHITLPLLSRQCRAVLQSWCTFCNGNYRCGQGKIV
uniref:Pyruvate kinase n=1 Tax=Nelumbo nucifera TaxID=4432 RepID=A0A822YY34_NELNU|nr:TPA_asm: hypothetical protein HUJ06_006735 [Nelumbo nucifera]